MSKVPDAWDDDYEVAADAPQSAQTSAISQPRISRAERKVKHQEANKQLWESAENPERFHFVEAQGGGVPLPNTSLKPALKVLARKPTKPADIQNGVQSLGLHDDDIDSEEEERREQERTRKEKSERAALERAEKQRKYAEVRERLFGSPAPSADSQSGRDLPTKRAGGRPKGRGGFKAGINGRGSQTTSSTEQSPARINGKKQLYDPNDSSPSKPDEVRKPLALTKSEASKPTREPKGPDGTGRGGFGFAPRGKSDP